jgi:hypothetical protein
MATPGLGENSDTCIGEVIEAMRSQIIGEAPDPGAGQALAANLESPVVRRNLAPVGEAVYRILTLHARPVSDASTDPAFWGWITDVQERVRALAAWQEAIAEAFGSWAPASASDQALKEAVTTLPAPSPAPTPAPEAVAGEIV